MRTSPTTSTSSMRSSSSSHKSCRRDSPTYFANTALQTGERFVQQKTRGDGNCAFHALLGSFNASTGEYEVQKVDAERYGVNDVCGVRQKAASDIRNSLLGNPRLHSYVRKALKKLIIDWYTVEKDVRLNCRKTVQRLLNRNDLPGNEEMVSKGEWLQELQKCPHFNTENFARLEDRCYFRKILDSMNATDTKIKEHNMRCKYERYFPGQAIAALKSWYEMQDINRCDFERNLKEEFLFELRNHSDILQEMDELIEKYITDKHCSTERSTELRTNIWEKYSTCISMEGSDLKSIILNKSQLAAAHNRFNEFTNKTFTPPWDEVLNNPDLVNEYATFFSTDGAWLSDYDIRIIAHIFNIRIDLYSEAEDVKEYNRSGTNHVAIWFNGSDHYERYSPNIINTPPTQLFVTPGTTPRKLLHDLGKYNQLQAYLEELVLYHAPKNLAGSDVVKVALKNSKHTLSDASKQHCEHMLAESEGIINRRNSLEQQAVIQSILELIKHLDTTILSLNTDEYALSVAQISDYNQQLKFIREMCRPLYDGHMHDLNSLQILNEQIDCTMSNFPTSCNSLMNNQLIEYRRPLIMYFVNRHMAHLDLLRFSRYLVMMRQLKLITSEGNVAITKLPLDIQQLCIKYLKNMLVKQYREENFAAILSLTDKSEKVDRFSRHLEMIKSIQDSDFSYISTTDLANIYKEQAFAAILSMIENRLRLSESENKHSKQPPGLQQEDKLNKELVTYFIALVLKHDPDILESAPKHHAILKLLYSINEDLRGAQYTIGAIPPEEIQHGNLPLEPENIDEMDQHDFKDTGDDLYLEEYPRLMRLDPECKRHLENLSEDRVLIGEIRTYVTAPIPRREHLVSYPASSPHYGEKFRRRESNVQRKLRLNTLKRRRKIEPSISDEKPQFQQR